MFSLLKPENNKPFVFVDRGHEFFIVQGEESQEASIVTLQKIERYLEEGWPYCSDEEILKTHPNPWRWGDLRMQLRNYAEELIQKTVETAKKINRVKGLLTDVEKQVTQLYVTQAKIIFLSKQIDGNQEVDKVLTFKALDIGLHAKPQVIKAHLFSFENFLLKLVKDKLIPACLIYKKNDSRQVDVFSTIKKIQDESYATTKLIEKKFTTLLEKENLNQAEQQELLFLGLIREIWLDQSVIYKIIRSPNALALQTLLPLYPKLPGHIIESALETQIVSFDRSQINEIRNNQIIFHKAIRLAKYEIVEKLVAIGADLETKEPDGQTPLACAANQRNSRIVDFLIKKGANVDCVDSQGNTPLMLLASMQNLKPMEQVLQIYCVRHLLNAGARVDLVNSQGQTALKLAEISETIALATQAGINNPNTRLITGMLRNVRKQKLL